ncbi:MAG TPA: type I-MYXAN CRISPR-associated protein Cas5/Cmx5/DevS [Pirellulales bacterium]|nr:type I-MYXAN CRISPR-associated protein Cas5/Cmx5/DevS [Pirellulales bacterium]
MLYVYLEAPFAACRTFTAGWYRPSATFLTPSAAYGLLLNVAGIESRLREEDESHDGRTPASLMRHGLPAIRIAVGVPWRDGDSEEVFPQVQTIYQQLHNYPVGKDAGTPAKLTKGNKNNITPVRRELLSGLRALVCLNGNADLEDRVRAGLRGEYNQGRYGLPFLGDNQFLLDRLEEPPAVPTARWYERVEQTAGTGPRPRTTRLTIWIDRADMSRTRSALYAPSDEASAEPPPGAWTEIVPPTPVAAAKPKRGTGKK